MANKTTKISKATNVSKITNTNTQPRVASTTPIKGKGFSQSSKFLYRAQQTKVGSQYVNAKGETKTNTDYQRGFNAGMNNMTVQQQRMYKHTHPNHVRTTTNK